MRGDVPQHGVYGRDWDAGFAVLNPSNGCWYVRDPAISQPNYNSGNYALPALDTDRKGDPLQKADNEY